MQQQQHDHHRTAQHRHGAAQHRTARTPTHCHPAQHRLDRRAAGRRLWITRGVVVVVADGRKQRCGHSVKNERMPCCPAFFFFLGPDDCVASQRSTRTWTEADSPPSPKRPICETDSCCIGFAPGEGASRPGGPLCEPLQKTDGGTYMELHQTIPNSSWPCKACKRYYRVARQLVSTRAKPTRPPAEAGSSS